MERFPQIIELVGTAIDGVGVVVLVIGSIYAIICFLLRRHAGTDSPYRTFRQNMGKAILLGLEFLIAGDIIRTVVVSPTIEHVLTLGLVVLLRTFLSTSLQLELEGRWPWQRAGVATNNPLPIPAVQQHCSDVQSTDRNA